MKKLYVLAGALFVASGAFAQGNDLFFSAYNEGAHPNNSVPPGGTTPSLGNERAIQIFNPTTATINMNQYSVARYSNGSSTVFQEEQTKRNVPNASVANTLTSGDVFVIGAFKATIPDIITNMDQRGADYNSTVPTVITTGGPVHFDGNDAMVLRRWTGGTAGQGTPVIIDIFGVIGNDPGAAGWITSIPNQPVPVRSANQSLNRKGFVENGIKTNPNIATYQIGDQWETFSAYDGTGTPTNTGPYFAQDYSNLVGHASRYTGQYGAYAPLGVLEDFNKGLTIYPNPVTDKTVKIKIENTKVSSITIINALGQNIQVAPAAAGQNEIKVDVSSLKPGLYFVKFVSADDYKMTVYKELLVR